MCYKSGVYQTQVEIGSQSLSLYVSRNYSMMYCVIFAEYILSRNYHDGWPRYCTVFPRLSGKEIYHSVSYCIHM